MTDGVFDMGTEINFAKYDQVKSKTFFKRMGKVLNLVGLTIESAGPDAKLADVCYIHPEEEEGVGIMAEVVGFREGRILLMPYESTEGIGIGNLVENTGSSLRGNVVSFLLGKTVDGVGRPTRPEAFVPENVQY